jgi:AraC-like DNA-binding protein
VQLLRAEEWEVGQGHAADEHMVREPKLIQIVEGEVQYVLQGQTYELARDMALYRPAWTSAKWWAIRPTRLCFCEFLASPPFGLTIDRCAVAMGDAAELQTDAIRRIMRLRDDGAPESQAVIEAELKAVLARCFRSMVHGTNRVNCSHATEGARTHAEEAVIHALSWLEENFHHRAALDELMKIADISPNHFRLVFRHITGKSPRQYLLDIRFRAAKWHLQTTDLSIKEIAASVGFPSARDFSRLFRKHAGDSPLAFRQAGDVIARPRSTAIQDPNRASEA